MHISLKYILLFLLGTLPVSSAYGQLVNISPMRVLINGKQRSAELRVINKANEPVQVETDFRFRSLRANNDGEFYLDSNVTPDEMARSCDTWIKVFPKKFVLGPKSTRVIRVIAMIPDSLDDGEYWSRLSILSEKVEGPRALSKRDTTQPIAFKVNLVTGINIPIVVRKGKAETGVELGSILARRDTAGMKIFVDTRRLGNSAYRGILSATVNDASGKEVAKGERKFSNLWDIKVRVDLPQLPDGTYDLLLESKSGGEGLSLEGALAAPVATKRSRLRVAGGEARVE